jgi:hypothetical protein
MDHLTEGTGTGGAEEIVVADSAFVVIVEGLCPNEGVECGVAIADLIAVDTELDANRRSEELGGIAVVWVGEIGDGETHEELSA